MGCHCLFQEIARVKSKFGLGGVAFEEGSGPQGLLKSGPGHRGRLKSGLLSQTMASYLYCGSEVKAGAPGDDHTASTSHRGHPASDCLTLDFLLEVLLDSTNCVNAERNSV